MSECITMWASSARPNKNYTSAIRPVPTDAHVGRGEEPTPKY